MPGKPPSGFLTLGPPKPSIPKACSTCAHRRKDGCSQWGILKGDLSGWINMELNEAWDKWCESKPMYKQSKWSMIFTSWKLYMPTWRI